MRRLEAALHALQLYGAAGIVAFGWAMGELLGWRTEPWLPLWFASALLIYNVDRLRRDPADLFNTPLRAASAASLRPASFAVAVLSAGVLLYVPIWRRDWLTLVLVVGGAFVSVQYSVPLLGFRFKDIPFLKSFFAPTIIVAAIFCLPWLHEGGRAGAGLAALWAWGYLEFNMILCDLRDIDGDRRCGIVSLPVRLGVHGTRGILLGLIVATGVVAAWAAWISWTAFAQGPSHEVADFSRSMKWMLIALGASGFPLQLLQVSYFLRSERFYEWAVEGMLFLPALVVWAAG